MDRQNISPAVPARYADGISRQARHFFGLAFVCLASAVGLAKLLMEWLGRTESRTLEFPPVFLLSSVLLFLGSLSLHRAVRYVRVEKQAKFRQWLLVSLFFGTMFMSVQSFGLWSMFPTERTYASATADSLAFILCLVTLHALHFLVAVLFVAFTISRTWANRYDHEYYWGVQICAWFWHFLGIVWIAILAVVSIAY